MWHRHPAWLLVAAALALALPMQSLPAGAQTADSILANKKAREQAGGREYIPARPRVTRPAAPWQLKRGAAVRQVFACYSRVCAGGRIWLMPRVRCTPAERHAGKACCDARRRPTAEQC